MIQTLLYVTLLLVDPLGSAAASSRGDLGGSPPVEEVPRIPIALEGTVLRLDGSPAQGAVVVSSAGGRAVTDDAGAYRLEIEVPLDAEAVEVSASGAGGTSRSATVPLGASASRVGALVLGSGSCASTWLPAFGGQPALNFAVNVVAVVDAGDGPALYAGGRFTIAGGVRANRIARWDGDRWSPLGAGMDGEVFALAEYDDGSGPALYAGGTFLNAGGEVVNRVAKWDGTRWSALGDGLSGGADGGPVQALTVFDDGSGPALYAGGGFALAGGAPAPRIARWDGTEWSAVGGGVGADYIYSRVLAMAVHDDGSGPALYAAGRFVRASGVTANSIARWDGTAWSALDSGRDDDVHALAVFDDGSGPALYAGGEFTGELARWDGTRWRTVGGGGPWLNSDVVRALTVVVEETGAALYVGGFTFAGRDSWVVRWDGTSWSADIDILNGGSVSTGIKSLVALDEGAGSGLLAAGDFFPGMLARLDGTSWKGLGAGPNARIQAVVEFHPFNEPGPGVVVGGTMTGIGGTNVRGIAWWNGIEWFGVGGGLYSYSSVSALAVRNEGWFPVLYAGGNFGSPVGDDIACSDGFSWWGLGSGVNGSVSALALFDDGSGADLYVGGGFTLAGGAPASRIARWDGSSWSALGSGVNGPVSALVVHDDGSGPALYAAGSFTVAGGSAALRIARWDGANWSALPDLSNNARALAVHDDGSGPALYAGGSFATAGGIPANGVARWDGTTWSALGSGTNGGVYALTSFEDENGSALIAGGNFTTAGGLAVGYVARWDGASWSALGGGVADGLSGTSVETLAVLDSGDGPALHVGGNFQSSPAGDSFLARWGRDRTAPVIASGPVVALDALGSAPGEVVHFNVTASDDTDPAPSVACVPPSGSFFPRGTTIVTCTATDACGNVSTAEFPVTVMTKARRR